MQLLPLEVCEMAWSIVDLCNRVVRTGEKAVLPALCDSHHFHPEIVSVLPRTEVVTC